MFVCYLLLLLLGTTCEEYIQASNYAAFILAFVSSHEWNICCDFIPLPNTNDKKNTIVPDSRIGIFPTTSAVRCRIPDRRNTQNNWVYRSKKDDLTRPRISRVMLVAYGSELNAEQLMPELSVQMGISMYTKWYI